MLRAALASYLAIATAVGPSLCCCATTSVVSSVRGWFGLEPIACSGGEMCSNPGRKAGVCHHLDTHRDGAHHSPCQAHAAFTEHQCRGKTSMLPAGSNQHRQPAGHKPVKPCPCKQDGKQPNALPASIVVAKTVLSTDVVGADGCFWLNGLSADVGTLVVDRIVQDFRSHPQTGREILRALHVLRC